MLVGKPAVRMYFCWCPPPAVPFAPPAQPPEPEPETKPGLLASLFGKPKPKAKSQPAPISISAPAAQTPTGFWLAQHPVNQAQWQAVMGRNPSMKGKGDNFPVDSVSWNDAQEFCERAGLRLPAETEWEHACRAGTDREFGVGTGQGLNSQLANFDGNYPNGSGPENFKWLCRERTTPEASFAPNAWGFHDMHGQLWEWCEDERKNGDRALRGGSWISRGRIARASSRDASRPDFSHSLFGFRPCPSSTSKAGASRGAGQGVK